jgi:hypothetical protein
LSMGFKALKIIASETEIDVGDKLLNFKFAFVHFTVFVCINTTVL